MPPIFRPLSDLTIPDIHRRDLPHWKVPGATYFLTFRLADALPSGALREIEHKIAAWLRAHGLRSRDDIELLPFRKRWEFRQLVTQQEEHWLDAGHGSCILRDPDCRKFLFEALHAFDGERYALDAFVIMPNHAHVLVQPHCDRDIIGSWKKYSSRRINERMNRTGHLWQVESFDHIVRSWDKLERFRLYIEENPQKARLREGDYTFGRGSGILQS